MNEIWKNIPGYEGLYQVSNLGNVKSKRRVLKPVSDRYLCVSLHKDRKQKKHVIHQLVVMAFIGVKSNHKKVIDHINSNKHDNRLDNLRVVDARFNIAKDAKSNTGNSGVYLQSGRYYSAIRIDGVKKHLGVFDTIQEAHEVYKKELSKIECN